MVQVRAMNHVIEKGQALYWGTSEWTAQVRPQISASTRAGWSSARPIGEHRCPWQEAVSHALGPIRGLDELQHLILWALPCLSQQLQEAWGIADRLGLVGPAVEQPEYSLFARQKVGRAFTPAGSLLLHEGRVTVVGACGACQLAIVWMVSRRRVCARRWSLTSCLCTPARAWV